MRRMLLMRELQNSDFGPNPRFSLRVWILRKSPTLIRVCQLAQKQNLDENHRILPRKRVLHFPLIGVIFSLIALDCTAASFDQAAEEIVEAGHFLNQWGLCPATSGNFSMRLDDQWIAVTVSGKHKGELAKEDVLIVDLNGNVQNSAKRASAETRIHTAIYAWNEDVEAVLHTHSLNGTVLTRLVYPSKTVVTEGYEIHKAFSGIATHESQVEIPIFENSQDIIAMANEISEYLKEHPNVYGFLIRGHGFYTWGRDMKEAKIRVEAFEYLFESEWKLRMVQK